ncbi:MAG: hypothetical protein ACI9SE_000095 [Neolewinella sp.]|jgi:hypothetical protein
MNRRCATHLLPVLTLLLQGTAAITQDKPVQGKVVQEKVVARKLPRVLLIGDISLNNHFDNAQKALAGKAMIVRSSYGYLPSGAALQRIDELLTQQKWDVVCFNFGLSDLMHKDPKSKQIRAMSPRAGGVPVTVPKVYAKNLERLVARFKKASGKVIWIPTLPLHPRQRSGAIDAVAIATYNTIALATMREASVPVLDLHDQIVSLLAKAENHRAKERLHHKLFKSDLSAPLVARIAAAAKH